MAGVTFGLRMPSGIAGQVHRLEASTIEPAFILATNPPTAYGVPVALDATSGKIRPMGATDTAASVYGFNVRPYPTTSFGTLGTSNDPLGVSTPPLSGSTSILKRGYINVLLNGTTAATKGGPIYIRIAAAAAGKPLGGVEAAADGANTVVLPAGSYFMGAADAAGNTEIAYNL